LNLLRHAVLEDAKILFAHVVDGPVVAVNDADVQVNEVRVNGEHFVRVDVLSLQLGRRGRSAGLRLGLIRRRRRGGLGRRRARGCWRRHRRGARGLLLLQRRDGSGAARARVLLLRARGGRREEQGGKRSDGERRQDARASNRVD
jgi:hypothetical protein